MPAAIGFALFQLGAPLALVNFVTIGFGSTLISTAIGVGLSLAANALLSGGSAAAIKPSDGQIAIRQAVPPRIRSYGQVRVAGVIWWLAADETNGYLYQGQALNEGRISEFVSYHIDNTEVEVDGSGTITTAPYTSLTSSGRKLLTRVGLATETAYSEIETAFGTANVRGDGVASMLAILDNFSTSEAQLKNFPNGRPQTKATIKASLVYDWRDTAQDRDDPTTWGWSENPVVCLADYLTSPAGSGLPWSKISANLAQWTAAAEVCDEPVLSLAAGAEEARYRIALTYALTDKPKDVIARILSTFDGHVWQKRDGSLGVVAGRFQPPAVTITDDHLTYVELTRGQDRLTAVAGLRAQYMSPGHDYREQDAEPWPNGATVAALDEDRVDNLDLTAVPSFAQARRLMKRAFVRANAPWRGTIRTTLYGLKAIDERSILLTTAEFGIDATFEVQRYAIDFARAEVEMEVIAVAATIDDWNPAEEEGSAPAIPEGLVYVTPSEHTAWNGNFDNHTSAWHDGNTNQDQGSASIAENTSVAWAGYTFSSPKAFGQAKLYGERQHGFMIIGDGTITLSVRGKTGSAPTAWNQGTLLGQVAVADPYYDWSGFTVPSDDTANTWDHIWFVVQTPYTRDVGVAEFQLWEWGGV